MVWGGGKEREIERVCERERGRERGGGGGGGGDEIKKDKKKGDSGIG